MQKPVVSKSSVLTASVLALAIAGGLAGCSKGETTVTSATDQQAALDAKAADLAKREAALTAKEESQKADASEPEVIQEPPTKTRSEAKPKAPSRRVAMAEQESAPRRSAPPAPPRIEYIDVPAGTALNLTLGSDLSSKTAVVGDAVEARLVSDLVINNHRVARANARVTGTVREVVSGSNTIGAVPLLALQFDHLEDLKGELVPIAGDFSAEGNSEKGQDAAKIIGGTAIGALLGSKIDKKNHKKRAIIGGLLGAGAGTVVAKKTGTEVALTSGYAFSITLTNSARVASN